MRIENPRTCLITGRKFPKEELLRLVVVEGKLMIEPSLGRGFYLSKEGLESPKALKKALRPIKRSLTEGEIAELRSHFQ